MPDFRLIRGDRYSTRADGTVFNLPLEFGYTQPS